MHKQKFLLIVVTGIELVYNSTVLLYVAFSTFKLELIVYNNSNSVRISGSTL